MTCDLRYITSTGTRFTATPMCLLPGLFYLPAKLNAAKLTFTKVFYGDHWRCTTDTTGDVHTCTWVAIVGKQDSVKRDI